MDEKNADALLGLDQPANNSMAKYAQVRQKDSENMEADKLLGLDDAGSNQNVVIQGAQAEPEGLWAKAMKEADAKMPVQKAAFDVVTGAAKGVVTSIEQTANFAIETADAVENLLSDWGVGGGKVLDENSRINMIEKMFDEPTTTSEYAGKMLGQYLAPFSVVGKLSKAKGILGAAQNVGLSSAISAMITDPDDKRLANLVQGYPALANPIAEFLAQDDDDPKFLSRIKTGMEAAMVDAATLGLFKAGEVVFKSMRAGKEMARARNFEKISKADPVPAGAIDEATVQANEVKINAEFEDQAAQAASQAKPKGEGGAAATPTSAQAKEAVKPKLPKDPPLTEEQLIQLRKAEDMQKPAPQTIKDVAKEITAANRPLTARDLHNVAKRGTVTDAESLKIAEKIFAKEGEIEAMLQRNIGDNLNQEQRNALKLDYMAKQVEFESTVAGIKNVDEMTDAELSVIQDQMNQMLIVDASADAASSESGRALRTSQKIPGLLEGGDDVVKMKKIKEHIKLYGGSQSIKDTIKQVKQIQDSGLSIYDVLAYKKKSIGSTVGDAAFEMWVNNVLSGVKTLAITNPVSNIAMASGMAAETAVSEIYGKLLGKGAVSGETISLVKAYAESFNEAWSAAKTMFKTGAELPTQRSKFLLSRKNAISAESFGLSPEGQIGKFVDVAGHIFNTPTRILSAQDVLFNTMSSRARIGQLTHRHAIQRGLIPDTPEYNALVTALKADPPQAILKEAERFGREATLTSPLGQEQGFLGVSGDTIQSLQQTMEKFPLGRYAGAFMRVGTNLTDRAVQRTPLSFLRPETRRNIFGGTTVSAQEEIAKMTFGTGVLFTGGLLAHNGLVTGGGPDEPKTIKALKSSGWQSYSIKTPNGGWIPTKEFGPIGKVLDISADIAELTGRLDPGDENGYLIDELIYAGSMVVMQSMTPDYLKDGVPDFFQFVRDVADGKKKQDDIAQAIGKFSTGFVPASSFMRSVKEVWRPEMGDTRVSEANGIIEKTWASVRGEWLKTAGLDGFAGLPAELNMFGEEVYSPMGVGGAIKSAVFGNSRDPNDPAVKEILRLDMTGGLMHIEGDQDSESFALRMPERVKRRGIGVGQGITVPSKLSPQEYHDYVKLSAGHKVGDFQVGPPLKDTLRDLVQSEAYVSQSDDMKKVLIKQIVSQYKKNAWQYMMMQPNIDEEFNTRRQNRVKNLFGRGT